MPLAYRDLPDRVGKTNKERVSLCKPQGARPEGFICCVGSFANAISIGGNSRLAAKTFRSRRGIKLLMRGSPGFKGDG